MIIESYPIERIRDEFPALQRIEQNHFVAYFDSPGGTQVAKSVIDAMSTYMKNGVGNLGSVNPTSRETAMIVNDAREHAAALLGTKKENIAFGANMTTLSFQIARALSKSWKNTKGNIVVTEMDHHANIDPWMMAAQSAKLTIQKIKLNTDTKTLNIKHIKSVINEATKLVAIGLASNVIGTINDYTTIIHRAKEVGALIALDGVHAAPHFALCFDELGADFLFCSAYKFFGPHIGIVAVNEDVFAGLETDKIKPALDKPPEKLETGTINFEGLVGLIEAIRFIASIGEGNLLREQLLSAYEKIEEYENYLANRLRTGLKNLEHVQLFQAGGNVRKTPTIAFQVKGMEAKLVCHYLAQNNAIHLEYGDFYASTLVEKLGVNSDSLVRAGIAPYNTQEEIDRLITAIEKLAEKLPR